MTKKDLIAIDSGKYATKAIAKGPTGRAERLIFRTKMDETNERATSATDSFVVSYKGHNLMIGKQAETVDYEKDKAKFLHKVSIFTAISQLVEDGTTVKIAVGCPMDLFNNVEERKFFRDFLLEDKEVNMMVNGKPHSFFLKDAQIFPESAGIVLRRYEDYKDRLVGVIDIGGLNINGSVYDRGDILKSTCFTTNMGANVMLNDLRLHLNQEFKSNIQDWQMESVIQDGFIRKDKEKSAAVLNSYLKKHINDIMTEALKRNWDVDNMEIIFTGGGSMLLKDQIKEVFTEAEISRNAVWDNVEGFGFVIGI